MANKLDVHFERTYVPCSKAHTVLLDIAWEHVDDILEELINAALARKGLPPLVRRHQ